MQIVLKILNLETPKDINRLRSIVSNIEGIIACEINKTKRELRVFFDSSVLNSNKIIAEIENEGFSVV